LYYTFTFLNLNKTLKMPIACIW